MGKIKALKSFAGTITMAKGEVRDYDDKVVVADLVEAGYVEVVDKKPAVKGGKKNESKRDNE